MASRKKHLAIRRSKRPWRNGEIEREREHILNRFPSSVRDVFMWRGEELARARTRLLYVYTYRFDAPREREKTRLFFWLGFEFKRFKAISQGVARRIVGS